MAFTPEQMRELEDRVAAAPRLPMGGTSTWLPRLLGFQGERGFQGPLGPQGRQGWQGCQGAQGVQGWQGTGVQGPQGWQGRQGWQGIQGWQGTGVQGGQGRQGWQGDTNDRYALGAARDFNNVTNSYLDRDTVATNVAPIVLPENVTLKAMSLASAAAGSWVAEVRLSGLAVPGANLSSGGGASAYSAAYSVDFSAGDGVQVFCNGSGVKKPRVTLWFQRR